MGTLLKARDLARSEFKANPYPFYARLRVEEPVCRIAAVFINGWLVTRYDDAVMVLKDPRISKEHLLEAGTRAALRRAAGRPFAGGRAFGEHSAAS